LAIFEVARDKDGVKLAMIRPLLDARDPGKIHMMSLAREKKCKIDPREITTPFGCT
jgi:hypothetical protein